LTNSDLNQLLMRVARRAENASEGVLRQAFVPIPSLISQLDTAEHQVLFGRRGTGKTHLLRHLQHEQECRGSLAVYLDLRRVGSPDDISAGGDQDFAEKATELLVDVLETIHESIYEQVLSDRWAGRLTEVSAGLDALAESATQIRIVGDTEIELQRESSAQVGRSAGAGLSLGRSPSISVQGHRRRERGRKIAERRVDRGRTRHQLLLGPLSTAIRRLGEAIAPHQLWLLIDEWSALPRELQPLMADLLRRTFFAAGGVVVKISAIHGRSRFNSAENDGPFVGLELGADTSATLDLDDFLLFRNDVESTVDFYSAMLFQHLAATARVTTEQVTLPGGVRTATALTRAAFATPSSFHNLILGAEGVPRDALQIAGLAAGTANGAAITSGHVALATRNFFLRDKEDGVPHGAPRRVFTNLVDQCARQRSRIIPLRRHGESDEEVIQRLYDARLIHRVRQGVSIDQQRPFETYDIYVIDYGCFLGLLHSGRVHSVQDGLDPGARFADLDEIEIRSRSFIAKPRGWYRQSAH
jgi:hypothetical protein